jgi:hypothetical protein
MMNIFLSSSSSPSFSCSSSSSSSSSSTITIASLFHALPHPTHPDLIAGRLCSVKQCNSVYAASTSTGSLSHHFKTQHTDIYDRFLRSSSEVLLELMPPLSANKKRHRGQLTLHESTQSIRAEAVAQAVVLYCAENMLSFRAVDCAALRSVVTAAGGVATSIPSRMTVSRSLQTVFQQYHALVVQKLRNQLVTVAIDGWTNVNSVKVTNIALICDGTVYYWCSINNRYDKNSATWLANEIKPVLQEFMSFQFRITAVVMDNENLNDALFSNILPDFPHLLRIPCAAHIVNLAVKSFLSVPSRRKTVETLHNVLDHFARSRDARCQYLKAQSAAGIVPAKVLLRPCDTRWNSMHTAAERLLDVRGFVNQVHPQDPQFWHDLDTLRSELQPFTQANNILQRDSATLYDVWQQFIAISSNSQALVVVRDRWQGLVARDAVFAVALLSVAINREQAGLKDAIRSAEEFIVSFGVKYLQYYKLSTLESAALRGVLELQLGDFLSRSGDFTNVEERVASTKAGREAMNQQWRPSDVRQRYTGVLSDVARALLSMCASEAAVERCFSAQDAIHTKKRNHLNDSTVQQLLFIKFNRPALFPSEKSIKLSAVELEEDYTEEIDQLAIVEALERTAQEDEEHFVKEFIKEHGNSWGRDQEKKKLFVENAKTMLGIDENAACALRIVTVRQLVDE